MMHTDKIFLEFKKLHAKETRRKNLEKMRKEQEAPIKVWKKRTFLDGFDRWGKCIEREEWVLC